MFLLLIAARNPLILLKTIGYFALFLMSQRHYAILVRNNVKDHHMVAGLTANTSSFHYRRAGFGFAYDAAHDAARLMLFQASKEFALRGNRRRDLWRMPFGSFKPGDQQLRELGAVVNKTTGTVVLERLGVQANQRHLERRLIFPRYIRCVFGLILDATQGGVRGNESRITVSLAALYITLAIVFI
jgi:hypothetical protein